MVDTEGYFATYKCPHDCPFRDKFDGKIKFCSFSVYAEVLEPGRLTRTEVRKDRSPDYHLPPDCDVYERYKDKGTEIKRMKHKYDEYGIKRTKLVRPKELYTTAHKHSPYTSKWRNFENSNLFDEDDDL